MQVVQDYKRREEDSAQPATGSEPTIAETDPATGIQRLIYSCPVDHTGLSVYVKGWRKESNKNVPLVLVHDIGENTGHYRNFATDLCAAGWSVYGFDLRGHGRSGRKLGHIPRFASLVSDLLQVAAWVRHREGGVAPVLVGQGIGAVIASQFHRAHGRFCSGLVLAAPSLEFKVPPGRVRSLLISSFAELAPTMRLPPALCPRFSNPTYTAEPDLRSRIMEALSPVHQHRLTAAFAAEVLRAVDRAEDSLLDVTCPTLVLLPEEDSLYSYEGLLRMLLNHPAAEKFKVANTQDTSHHLLGDGVPDRAAIVGTITAWLRTLVVQKSTDRAAGGVNTDSSEPTKKGDHH